ncbi:hypothetical protein Y032_0056g2718 [Ancylostoma ceylanicum]|uniref:BPTI/Kunitz inhibitor domain-containing protein n=1 Tax=Ancylostoma ceylanicum TaxID=53326 RepID=A0A016U608_9BILA|nr:hypothetical protein Y032_0056g2718 [Ancylostoma ceylanicum]
MESNAWRIPRDGIDQRRPLYPSSFIDKTCSSPKGNWRVPGQLTQTRYLSIRGSKGSAIEMLPLVAAFALALGVRGSSDPCTLPLDAGHCLAFIKRYGYNTAKGKCVEFVYGGCEGNENNFVSMENCEKECVGKGPNLDKKVSVPNRAKRSLSLQRNGNLPKPFQGALGKVSSMKNKIGGALKKVKSIFGKNKKQGSTEGLVGTDFEKDVWSKHKQLLIRKVPFCMQIIDLGSKKAKKVVTRYVFDKNQGKCIQIKYRRPDKEYQSVKKGYIYHTNKNNFEFISDCKRECEGKQHEEPDLKAILASEGIYT